MRPRRPCRRLACFLALSLALLGGCKRSPTVGPAASNDRPSEAVPAPEGLVAELLVPHPDRSWESVRATIAGAAPLLPSSAAVFLGGTLGLPVSTFDQIDLVVPVVGAVVEMKDELAGVLAVHVKDGSRFVELCTSGTPRFAKIGTQDGVTSLASPAGQQGGNAYAVSGNYLVLSQNAEALRRFAKIGTQDGVTSLASPAGQQGGNSFAVSGNYLVLSQNAEALRRFAPFVTRTLPTRPAPPEDLVATASHDALSGPVLGRAKKVWDSWKQEREAEDAALRAKHGGSAPDFGDPAQALADIDTKAARFFSILGDLKQARLAVSAESKTAAAAASFRVLVSVTPLSESGVASQEIASMAVARADPLLSLPEGVAVALLMRDTAEQRAQSSASQVEAISKVLGERLEPDDKRKVAAAFESWSKGRGDWLTAGLAWSGRTRAALIRGAVADEAELGRGISAMIKLVGIRAISDPLSKWVGDIKISEIGSSRDGVVQTVHVVRRPPRAHAGRRDKSENDSFDVVWSIGKEVFGGAAGYDAKGAHAALETASSERTLGQEPFVARAVDRLGPHVSFALLVDTAKLTDTGSPSPEGSSFLLSYGKDSQNVAWFELDAPAAVLASYATLLGTLR